MQSGITSSASETFAANRAVGAVTFDVHLKDGKTRRRELHESGSLRVRFPSPEQQGLSAVFVNTAGGVAGGLACIAHGRLVGPRLVGVRRAWS